mgnify:CR=1 FL=1
MLPSKEFNIYSKTNENLQSLINYYFDKYELPQENAIEYLQSKTKLSLNQVEFIASKLSASWENIFSEFFNGKTTVANLMKYGIDGLTEEESNWNIAKTSSGRPKIKEFINFVKETEIDFEYLKTNN